MQRFKAGELDVLVSTTVIEVGVDVPNATVMVIENAERFGLSALHQLRGRVGRGAADSCCILISDNGNDAVRERLQFLCRTSDGFAVAKYDLETRGPGDFFGSAQHGLPTLRVADLVQDTRTLRVAQDLSLIHICTVYLDADLELTGSGFAGIPSFSGVFEGQGHTISGLSLVDDGSVIGFFRYVQQGANVRDLVIRGRSMPTGSRSTVGGIAGSNAGTLHNLSLIHI